jgi:hypothetical protein
VRTLLIAAALAGAPLVAGCATYQIPEETWMQVEQIPRAYRGFAVPAERGAKPVYLLGSDLRPVDDPLGRRPSPFDRPGFRGVDAVSSERIAGSVLLSLAGLQLIVGAGVYASYQPPSQPGALLPDLRRETGAALIGVGLACSVAGAVLVAVSARKSERWRSASADSKRIVAWPP